MEVDPDIPIDIIKGLEFDWLTLSRAFLVLATNANVDSGREIVEHSMTKSSAASCTSKIPEVFD